MMARIQTPLPSFRRPAYTAPKLALTPTLCLSISSPLRVDICGGTPTQRLVATLSSNGCSKFEGKIPRIMTTKSHCSSTSTCLISCSIRKAPSRSLSTNVFRLFSDVLNGTPSRVSGYRRERMMPCRGPRTCSTDSAPPLALQPVVRREPGGRAAIFLSLGGDTFRTSRRQRSFGGPFRSSAAIWTPTSRLSCGRSTIGLSATGPTHVSWPDSG
mmetsp:Transcript_27595/g.78749  ORF Transcript_27595/g.78749 Transcript_27595/m.78749 type:complete len:214 (+) Transcript_27595:255-896(+)